MSRGSRSHGRPHAKSWRDLFHVTDRSVSLSHRTLSGPQSSGPLFQLPVSRTVWLFSSATCLAYSRPSSSAGCRLSTGNTRTTPVSYDPLKADRPIPCGRSLDLYLTALHEVASIFVQNYTLSACHRFEFPHMDT